MKYINRYREISDVFYSLYGRIATEDFGTKADVATVESALVTLGNSMQSHSFKNIRFAITTPSGAFSNKNGYYIGTIKKTSTDRLLVEVQCDRANSSTASGDIITGVYYNSSWTWRDISAEVTTLNASFTSVSATSITDFNSTKTPGYYKSGPSTTNSPASGYFSVSVIPYSVNDLVQIAVEVNTRKMYFRTLHDGTTWTSWNEVVTKNDSSCYTYFLATEASARTFTITSDGNFPSLFTFGVNQYIFNQTIQIMAAGVENLFNGTTGASLNPTKVANNKLTIDLKTYARVVIVSSYKLTIT